jgi:IclR family transcriptional regulator, KDG regulon repressor
MVQVLIKAFDILELVANRNGQAISLTEISQELGLNQATTANIINTMVSKGYLEHIGKKKGYRLGQAAFQLTNEVSYEQDLITASLDPMKLLTNIIDESSLLGILRDSKRYILHNVNCNQDIQVQIRSERNVYETASGRLLIAYLSEKERERFLQINGLPDKTLWPEAIDKTGFEEELFKIRKNGLVKTNFQNTHLVGFAVPIYYKRKVIASLSVFLPEFRNTPTKEEQIIQELKLTVDKIETEYTAIEALRLSRS